MSLARQQDPDLEILLGHGSGSFGHYAAKDYGTRDHVSTPREWGGFQEVWLAARHLNQIVIDEFVRANLPVISLPPSASILAKDHMIKDWTSEPIRSALQHGLIPVIYGDVVFDEIHGGNILSTEDLFTGVDPVNQTGSDPAGREGTRNLGGLSGKHPTDSPYHASEFRVRNLQGRILRLN